MDNEKITKEFYSVNEMMRECLNDKGVKWIIIGDDRYSKAMLKYLLNIRYLY